MKRNILGLLISFLVLISGVGCDQVVSPDSLEGQLQDVPVEVIGTATDGDYSIIASADTIQDSEHAQERVVEIIGTDTDGEYAGVTFMDTIQELEVAQDSMVEVIGTAADDEYAGAASIDTTQELEDAQDSVVQIPGNARKGKYASAAYPSATIQELEYAQDRILVAFEKNTTGSEKAQIHQTLGGKVQSVIPGIGVDIVSIPKGLAKEKAGAYSNNPKVRYAEPDFLCQAIGEPNDGYYYQQWGMDKVQAPLAWDTARSNSAVNIAILDTGVDGNHVDLAGKVVAEINFSGSLTSNDVYGHGTHVAGIASASTNNGIGVAGLGYDSTIMNVKVLGDTGSGYYSWVAAGVNWAADNGAEIINMSLGGASPSLVLEDAINYAWSKGVLVVTAAGNSGSSSPFYPAYYENCIAVAATDMDDNLPFWSNYGNWVDVAAPGYSIYSTLINDGYGYKSGTSMASPHVAGLAALLVPLLTDSNNSGHNNDEIRNRIQATADNIGLTGIGSGRINAYQAVNGIKTALGTIAGRITDAVTGLPISGALVNTGVSSVTSDANGDYVIGNMPEGTYIVTVSATGYIPWSSSVTVTGGATTVADFALTENAALGTIAGRVTDSGTSLAIAGVLVNAGASSAITDANGDYVINSMPEGTYTVTASATGYNSSSLSVTVTGNATTIADFALTEKVVVSRQMWVEAISFKIKGRNLFIDAKVTGESGSVAGASVGIRLEWNGGTVSNFRGSTDTTGMVQFKLSKASAGEYQATVTGLACSGYRWDQGKGIISNNYNLTNGNTKGNPKKH